MNAFRSQSFHIFHLLEHLFGIVKLLLIIQSIFHAQRSVTHIEQRLQALNLHLELFFICTLINRQNLERQLFGNALSLFPVAGIHLLLLRPLLDQHIYLALGARLQGLFFIKHIIVESLFPHIVRLGRIVRNRSVFPALLPGLYGWVFP